MKFLTISRESLLVLGGVVVVLGIIDVCHAADATTMTSTGCVDKTGFERCLDSAVTGQTICLESASSNNLILGCGYAHQIRQMNCYMSNCWNKIYSCEYSGLAAKYTADRGLVTPETIPFWPAPANAPGACSCNIGQAFINSSQLFLESIGCMTSFTGVPDIFGCTCCAYDGALSALYATCPNNNPDYLGYDTYYKVMKDYESQLNGLSLGTCAEAITGDNCPSKWGIDPPAGGKFLEPDTLSKSFGSEALSTLSGTVTSPPGGPTFTWSILGVQWTVTAASVNGVAASNEVLTTTPVPTTVVVTTTNSNGETIVSTSTGTVAVSTGSGSGSANSAVGRDVERGLVVMVGVAVGVLLVI